MVNALSALAAICTAITAILVFSRDWVREHPLFLKPPCYWLGYMERGDNQKSMYIVLPIHAVSGRGLSSVIRDITLRVEELNSNHTKIFQPEYQIDIDQIKGQQWSGLRTFIPFVVEGRAVSSTIVIFGERGFRGNSLTEWSKGSYRVRAKETIDKRGLFELEFQLPEDVLPQSEELTIKVGDHIVLTPRRWSQEVIESRDSLGGMDWEESENESN